jgi:hypothetical protein
MPILVLCSRVCGVVESHLACANGDVTLDICPKSPSAESSRSRTRHESQTAPPNEVLYVALVVESSNKPHPHLVHTLIVVALVCSFGILLSTRLNQSSESRVIPCIIFYNYITSTSTSTRHEYSYLCSVLYVRVIRFDVILRPHVRVYVQVYSRTDDVGFGRVRGTYARTKIRGVRYSVHQRLELR